MKDLHLRASQEEKEATVDEQDEELNFMARPVRGKNAPLIQLMSQTMKAQLMGQNVRYAGGYKGFVSLVCAACVNEFQGGVCVCARVSV